MERSKDKTPEIRFPEFKDTWQHKKLSEFLVETKKRNGDLKYGKEEVLSVSGELGIVNNLQNSYMFQLISSPKSPSYKILQILNLKSLALLQPSISNHIHP
ncbi:hypothetical protein [Algoriphagus aquimarinus]|uniref:hypothetical protein n=1 Tax=Algoriphagus aquimarinus TaxID=237018 RepID=UPI0030DC4B6D